MRNLTLLLLALLSAFPVFARQVPVLCGTRPGMWKEEQFLHRQTVRARGLRRAVVGTKAAGAVSAVRTIGDIAVMEDADGVVSRRNEFNLNGRTLTFTPAQPGATRYRYETGAAGYDAAAATAGAQVPLTDDDSRRLPLPFPFPFYGAVYNEVYINSDGNLTFTAGDNASTERSLGRVNAGPPRIAPLFDDLDPTRSANGVRALSEPGRFVVSWPQVPEWVETGSGAVQTFQVRLYPDGRIEFAYDLPKPTAAVVGISPGLLNGSATLVSFTTDLSGEYAGAVAERFGGNLELDVTTAAQKFYEVHADAYDFLVFFNSLDVEAGSGAVAWESTLRNSGQGFGDQAVDVGREFGSRARLQSIMNMGHLSQYDGPHDPVRRRSRTGDTPVTVLAHEAGHRFLAYASVLDPAGPFPRPMLGFQNAHWSFAFNSEASLLEGNRIRDNGENADPRFETTGTVEGYSPLDQYLMGLRGPEEVEPEHQMFFASDTNPLVVGRLPERNVSFNGVRRNVAMGELVGTMGRRTPDHTVAQRRFRFAFILVVPKGGEPSAEDVAKVDSYRTAFEEFFSRATSNRAVADTSLKFDLRLSVFPAAGLLEGRSATARVAVDTPPAAPLTVVLRTQTGAAQAPGSVTIPAGAAGASFTIDAVRTGVEELLAEPDDPRYRTAAARVRVAGPGEVRIMRISQGTNPLLVRVTDINGLPYPGVRVDASPFHGGVVDPAFATTDDTGTASFRWAPAASSQLHLGLEGGAANLTLASGPSMAFSAAVVNAASFAPALAPGALATVFGSHLAAGASAQAESPLPTTLAGVRVLLNGAPVPLLWAADNQVNFLVPASQPEGNAELVVVNAAGATAPITVQVGTVAPGIFFDTFSGHGAILHSGTAETTFQRPVARGGYIEIYCTGLGPVAPSAGGLAVTTLNPEVTIGGELAPVVFSGMAPGLPGVYQVNVQVPAAAPSGSQPLSITLNGMRSNEVKVRVE